MQLNRKKQFISRLYKQNKYKDNYNKQQPWLKMKPGICKGKESNLTDPEEVQRYPMDSLKDHQGILPASYEENKKQCTIKTLSSKDN